MFGMTIFFVVLSLGVGSLWWLSRRLLRQEELGSVSARWLAEYRQNQDC
jgi:hypothetical protein